MKHTRRSFIRTAALGSTAAALSSRLHARVAPAVSRTGHSKAPARPNLLFLWTDQHRADCVPWSGNRALKAPDFFTPLGESSFVFQRAYCTQPVCTPSRASIMSGLWPHNNGVWTNNRTFNPGVRTMAEFLPAGYATGYYGKWHLGNEITPQREFDDWRSIEDHYRQHYTNDADRSRRSDYHNFLVAAGFPPDHLERESGTAMFSREFAAALPEPYSKAAYLAGEAVDFLQARRDGQPFVLHVNTLEPHPPTYGPLNELHDPSEVLTGPAFARRPDRLSKLVRYRVETLQREGYGNHPIETEGDWRRLRSNYYGLVSMVDRAYARIMRALVDSGQADNTIVVFTSDHGDMAGDYRLAGKDNFYDASAKVPLAIHVPWLSRSRVDFQTPISLVDLMPTLLELMNVDVGAGIDGVSRARALQDPASWRDENVTCEWNHLDEHDEKNSSALSGRSRITADGWKLNLYHDDVPELFDLNTDPGELNNLAGERIHADRIRRLAEELRDWQTRTSDTLPLAV